MERRGRSRKRRSHSDPGSPLADEASLFESARTHTPFGGARVSLSSLALFTLVLSPALALGAVHFYPLLFVAGGAFLATAYLCWRAQVYVLPAAIGLVVSGYCLLQATPLPLSLLEVLSPRSAEVWVNAHLLTDSTPPSAASLSIDPGASLREALKWSFYASLLMLSSRVTRRHGMGVLVAVVFVAATVLAIVTIAHGLLGAASIYGFYERSFRDAQWALSPLVNKNNLAGYLNLGFFTGLAVFIKSRDSVVRTLIGACMALMASLSLSSGSRGAAGTLLAGSALCGIFLFRSENAKQKRKGSTGAEGIFAIILLTVLALALLLPEPTLRALGERNIDKVHMVRWVAPLIKDYPWFGVGAGAFETGFLPYRAQEDGVIWTHPENFLVGWVTEFGVPVSVLLLGAFIFAYTRARRTFLRPARIVAWVAVGAWFAHNLFDLAVVVPGAFAAVITLLGGLLEPSSQGSPARSPRASRARWFPAIVSATGLLTAALAFKYASTEIHTERARLHQALVRGLASESARKAFFDDLGAALKRHPGDAYLFRLGAIAAVGDPDQSSLRWLGRALERDMMSSESHFVLAQDLARRGALAQALMELRLAVQRSHHLAPRVAAEAVRWTHDRTLLAKIVPDGPSGAHVSLALARALPRKNHEKEREAFLMLAIAHDPQSPEARLLLVEDLLTFQHTNREACESRQPPCTKIIETELSTLKNLEPHSEATSQTYLQLIARFHAQSGHPEKAVSHLLNECSHSKPACLHYAVTLSATHNLSLEQPARRYLASSCPDESPCIQAHQLLGSIYGAQQSWAKALDHHKAAAELSGSARDFLAAAQAAQRLGLLPEALKHIRSLGHAQPLPTDAEREQALRMEQQIEAEAQNKLLQDLTQP